MNRHDDLMSTVFGQLELLQDMAIRADDPDLAADLSRVFAATLDRYCNRKREEAIARLSQGVTVRAG